MKHILVIIHEILYSFDWYSLLIVLGVCAVTIFIGLIVASPMGVSPI
jgi:hypothetical protein